MAAAEQPAPSSSAARSWAGLGALALWGALAAPWALGFKDGAVESYMDEIFHEPQTVRYCEGRISEWDPKITTFPGLYVLAAGAASLLDAAGAAVGRGGPGSAGSFCSLDFLRALNLLYGGGCLFLLQRLFLRRRMSSPKAAAHALVLALYPVHFFYTFLYYTDVGSLFFTLLCHHLATPSPGRALPSARRIAMAAVAGGFAIFFRQTNAVWVMFTFGTAALSDLEAAPASSAGADCADGAPFCERWRARFPSPSPSPLSPRESPSKAASPAPPALPVALASFAWALLRSWRRLLGRLGPLLVPPLLFAGFVVLNGSIVVGDHSNHQAVPHFAQLAYVTAAMAWSWAPFEQRGALRELLTSSWGSLRGLASAAAALAVTAWVLRRYSFAHPFLLADNRHYTFYVWNRFLGRIPGLKEALAPAYLYSAFVVRRRLAAVQSELWLMILLVACVLTLVPAHLLEPRYWTTAVVIAHAHAPEQSWRSLGLAGAVFLAVDFATLAVFRFRPFAWPGGEVARFMF